MWLWAFFQHLIRAEIDIEKAPGVADPGLSFVGQGRLESKEVEVVVHERKEVKPGWNGQVGGVGFSVEGEGRYDGWEGRVGRAIETGQR